ncbi:PaaI family thioesterase [Heliophilum fasciatum]|uniref:Acyl-coenzyme A thioesterase THEM4 n=1 Tax=Heliophilum fasciatum TaxID=35700 RepID=A0A4R2RF74_9FIRM|nr:PaaI family thioesterase [Heliophilum fasciatum]MCW2279060.1 acyl-coenzyme A thioesterase PaaI-like protein [Heliophilum fasciatum]TCP61523.1 thioesterase superfamily protein [Heliophilum fasciatum]
MTEIFDLSNYNMCFCCGKDNPIGLHLDFGFEGDEYVTYFTPSEVHQSYPGVTHGGLISTVLDEVMGKQINEMGMAAFTARMDVRWRHAIPIGEKVRVASRLVRHKGKLMEMAATVHRADGSLAAEATARFMVKGDFVRTAE